MSHHTATPSASTARTPAPPPAALGTLHLVRAAFSLVWVGLVLATSTSLLADEKPSLVAGVLLVVYPLWDVVATLQERRLAGAGATDRVSTVNLALGLVAALAMVAAVLDTIGTALLVFGVWALLSGALQLTVALRRRRTLGAQWPMMISGGLSVLAGASFAAMSTSSSSDLTSVAGYSAFGAFWFLVSGVLLSVRARRGR